MGRARDIDLAAGEVTGALHDVARLVWHDVPGCDGASVSRFHDWTPSTLAASHARVRGLDDAQYRRGRGPCVEAMRRHETVTVDDFRTDPRWPEVSAELVGAGARSSLFIPLADGGRTIGALNLYADTPRSFTAAAGWMAVAYGRQAALVLRLL